MANDRTRELLATLYSAYQNGDRLDPSEESEIMDLTSKQLENSGLLRNQAELKENAAALAKFIFEVVV